MKNIKKYITIILCGMLLILSSCTNNFNVNSYLNSYNSPSKSISTICQTTTIKDDETLVYEKTLNYTISKSIIKVEVQEKSLSQDLLSEDDYIITNQIVYFANGLKYYKDGEIWKTENCTQDVQPTKVNIKGSYIETFDCDTQIEQENNCTLFIKQENTSNILGFNATNLVVKITIDKNAKMLNSLIEYTNSNGRYCTLASAYGYEKAEITLPNVQ